MNPYEARRRRLDQAEAEQSGARDMNAERARIEAESKKREEENRKKREESKGYWFQRLFGG